MLNELRLTLHPEKTRIVDVRDTAFDFLGFTFFWVVSKDGSGRPLFGPKQAAVERFKEKVRRLTRRTRPMNLQRVIDDLAPVIRGGFPIGSGIIESACKTVLKQRESGSGMRGIEAGAQAIATLRALHRSGNWHAFWHQDPWAHLVPRFRRIAA